MNSKHSVLEMTTMKGTNAMHGLLGILSILFSAKEIVKEAVEKPAPQGTRFDWDAYWEDVRNGMTSVEQIKKRQRGGYLTTKPKPPEWYELPLDTVVDTERYENDKKQYGESVAEQWRKTGSYRQIRKR